MNIKWWLRIKRNSEVTEVRITDLIKNASKADKDLQEFGSQKHKYKLNKCASSRDVENFEQKYTVTLPDDYKEFITKIGNGGAGPYYGIYPLTFEKDCDEYKYASKPCRLFPHMKLEDWQEVLSEYNNMAEDATDEEYDRLYNEVWQGMITIGTQGCTYDILLVISGEYRGKVVYVDRTMDENIPFFVYEDNFLQWYERWLIEIINGYDTTWFGFKMGGDERELIDKFNICINREEKLIIIESMLKFRDILKGTKESLYNAYKEEIDNDIKKLILSVLVKYKHSRTKVLIKEALKSDNKNEIIKIIFYYDKENFNSWHRDILQIGPYLNSEGIRAVYSNEM